MKKKVQPILIAMFLILALCVTFGPQSVALAEESEPAAIEDLYEIDGVSYYNTGSENFDQSQYDYIKEVLGNPENSNDDKKLAWKSYNRSMSDLWLEVAAGLLRGKDYLADGRPAIAMDKAACQGSNSGSVKIGGQTLNFTKYPMVGQSSQLKSDDMKSLKKAEQYLYKISGMSGDPEKTGNFKNDDTQQTTAVSAIKVTNGSSGTRIAAVYFTNFKIVALFPEDKGDNYVTTMIRDDEAYSDTVASSVKNNSATTASGSQKVSSSYSASMSSSVSGSKTYSYQEGIKVGNEFSSGFFNKFSVDVSFTATQAFQKGWSKSESVSEQNGSDQSISVNLPPYTNVMMKQKTTNAEAVTKYNCPVAITFDTKIVIYDNNGVLKATSSQVTDSPMVFSFSGTARETLKERYREWKGEHDRVDSEGINWYYVTSLDGTDEESTHIAEAIEKASSFVPMAPTGAEFRQKLKLVGGEIDGVMPILPLSKVKLDSLDLPFNQDSGTYNSFNYLSMELPVGKSTYTKYFKLSGYNKKDESYFGFSKDLGSWKLTDENGDALAEDNAPVKLEKEKVSGYSRISAVKPGVCYLKYFINEDAYNTSDNLNHFTTNDELETTAVVKIIVPENRTITVSGSFEGYAGDEPEALDADGKLYASVCDATGKEIDADISWEKKEKNNIDLSDNMVSFTKPGKYHVRACSGDLSSDWIEITAKDRKDEEKKIDEDKKTEDKPKDVIPESGKDNATDSKNSSVSKEDNSISEAAADAAITKISSEKDPAESSFLPLMLTSKKQTKTSIKLQWKKVKGAESYVIYGVKCGKTNKPVKLKKVTGTSYNVKKAVEKIKAKTYYKFIVVALDKNNKVITTSKMTHVATKGSKKATNAKAVSVKVKKKEVSSVKLKKGKTVKLKAKAVKAKKSKIRTHVGIRYESSNKKIATVNKKGKIKGVKKGKAKIYVYAQNGRYKMIKVTVR